MEKAIKELLKDISKTDYSRRVPTNNDVYKMDTETGRTVRPKHRQVKTMLYDDFKTIKNLTNSGFSIFTTERYGLTFYNEADDNVVIVLKPISNFTKILDSAICLRRGTFKLNKNIFYLDNVRTASTNELFLLLSWLKSVPESDKGNLFSTHDRLITNNTLGIKQQDYITSEVVIRVLGERNA